MVTEGQDYLFGKYLIFVLLYHTIRSHEVRPKRESQRESSKRFPGMNCVACMDRVSWYQCRFQWIVMQQKDVIHWETYLIFLFHEFSRCQLQWGSKLLPWMQWKEQNMLFWIQTRNSQFNGRVCMICWSTVARHFLWEGQSSLRGRWDKSILLLEGGRIAPIAPLWLRYWFVSIFSNHVFDFFIINFLFGNITVLVVNVLKEKLTIASRKIA